MAYWLFKSEPNAWSWDDQVKAGRRGDEWDGVRNYQARNFMQEMKKGDLGFFYHSVKEKSAVGIVEVVKEAHPDSTDDTGKWFCVDVRAVEPLPTPVTLDQVKAEPKLEKMALVANSRLSVQPVTAAEWRIVCRMGGLKNPPTVAARPAAKSKPKAPAKKTVDSGGAKKAAKPGKIKKPGKSVGRPTRSLQP